MSQQVKKKKIPVIGNSMSNVGRLWHTEETSSHVILSFSYWQSDHMERQAGQPAWSQLLLSIQETKRV